MAKKTLVISGDDPHRFFLSLEGGTLTVGDRPTHAEAALWGLHAARVRVEIEVEDDAVAVNDLAKREAGDASASQELQPGLAVHVGHSHFCLLVPTPGGDRAKPGTAVSPALPADAPKPDAVAYRLRVVDGADQGKNFSLPHSGTVSIGKSNRHAGIVLHDLYVARLHCELTIEDGVIFVAHVEGEGGTRIDGTPIVETAVLRPGCVLRVGNSHLRLETGPVTDAEEDAPISAVGPASGRMKPAAAGPASERMKRPSSGSAKSSDPLAPLEGQTFGKYRLGPPIARGLTGTVFQAQDLNSEQVVAIKVLLEGFPAGQAELDKFGKAMKEAAAVHHPNLTAMYGGGRNAGHVWLARECVDGECVAIVAQRIADGERPSWVRACRVAVHLARALTAVHQHQMIHGHIAGRHVLLANADSATKLTDLLFAQATEGSRLRRSIPDRRRVPEMGYMAPEQTEDGAFVDQLADLYSLGAVAYALLTGRPPFTGDSAQEVIDEIRTGRPTKPTEFHRKIPAAFEGLVLKLLARHQEDRYQTAAELLADLEAIAGDHDIKV